MSLLRNKSEHQWVGESLSAYIDGELAAGDRTRVEQHLKECQACAENLRTLRETVALLKELPAVPAPRSFAVSSRVARPRPAPAPSAWGYGLLKGATAMAALLLVLLVGGDLALHVLGGPLVSWAPAAPAPGAALAPSYETDLEAAPREEVPTLGQEKESAELQATPPENAQEVAPTAPSEPPAAFGLAGGTATLPPEAGGALPAGTPTAQATPEPSFGAGPMESAETPTPVPAGPAPSATGGEAIEATIPPADAFEQEREQRAVAPGPEETPLTASMAGEHAAEVAEETPPPPSGGTSALSLLHLTELMVLAVLLVLAIVTALTAWRRHRAS